MLTITCQTCSSKFDIKPSRLKTGGKYCSRKCWHKANRPGKTVACSTCGKETYKQRKALRASKSGKFFCGRSCQTKWRNVEFSEDKHANWKGGTHAYRRKMLQSNKRQECGLCRIQDIRILAVHHLDENRKNNHIDNLVWLCHNCHHLIHHYPDEAKKYMAAIV